MFSDNTTVADTPSLCQYTCNDGYKLSTGLCTSSATCNQLQATITSGGTGYTTAPTVTLSNTCPTTVTATATVAS